MSVFLLILIGILVMSPQEKDLVITQKTITVSGQTSIGAFNCSFSRNGMKDTISLNSQINNSVLNINIPVSDFACGNFILNRDFRKTIKAEEFPTCEVKVANLRKNRNDYTCRLTVSIVGKTLEFDNFYLKHTKDGLEGNLSLAFSDLALEAPKKMGGLIKVEEQLDLQIVLGF
ncbi:hypothetical protein [Mongoliitalea daihaiensis]|uniref:hypothetical protein n=1 Tax=Mongoliitalea daihaiensis TaxID=2782006 RepID=UPI001F206DB8|nr:hypothetical protein [Mongoliitalea daihaiensis]UJP63871.1 hypothetical protein IPZ59_13680 [Mongoliitalea daihaiensis]